MSTRTCLDCGTEISLRAKRCRPCKAEFRGQNMRDRRAAEKAGIPPVLCTDAPLVDYTLPGAASKPPSFDGVRHSPGQQLLQEVFDGRVLPPGERLTRHDLTGIPPKLRQSRAKLDEVLAGRRIMAEHDRDENDMMN